MTSNEIRQKFLTFFKERGHAIVPSSSLIPDDPSVLLTTAGMQQFKPYLTGKLDPMAAFKSSNVFSIQKCFRTTDIDEIGDNSHLTFFEMIGNFSFGGYFKETAIPLSYEFITSSDGLGLDPHKLFVTAFKGDAEVLRDDEAIKLWQVQFKKAGINAKTGERIFLYGREKNWWEAGLGPCGPDAEMFFDRGTPHNPNFGPACHPNCDCGRFIEIGNDVFIQYNKTSEGVYEPLAQKGIDNGRGFERLVMVMQGKSSIFETDLLAPFLQLLPDTLDQRKKRIIVDHLRSAVFLITDGVRPSNKDAGYILRRLLRRILAYEHTQDISPQTFETVLIMLIELYGTIYPGLQQGKNTILNGFWMEQEKFAKALTAGQKEMNTHDLIDAKIAFHLYESYGLPYEVIKEIGPEKTKQLTREAFDQEFKKHQEISRAGVEKKFGGHGLLLDTGELKAANEEELNTVTRLHSATHLLQAALRKVLGDEVRQMGSDITAERTRFDFSFERKVTKQELVEIEKLVNDAIRRDLVMEAKKMPYEEAVKTSALYFFREKYPEEVNIFSAYDPESGEVFSREFCGGPHVSHSGEIGVFKIIKEESSSAGVRRIRAIIQ